MMLFEEIIRNKRFKILFKDIYLLINKKFKSTKKMFIILLYL